MARKQRKDHYQEVTNMIIEELEKGVRPLHKPWSADHAAIRITIPKRHTGEAYRGINILTLWIIASKRGYTCPTWMTYRQTQQHGGQVRKGEKSAPVFYASSITVTEENEEGEEEEQQIPFMKAYSVFNVEQIDGLPAEFYHKPEPPAEPEPMEQIEAAEQFMAGTRADIRQGGPRAYYSELSDHIQLPPMEAFRDSTAFYTTAAHELVHWTKHPRRLDRNFGRKKWGDQGYAREELVAELGAAFLAGDLGIMPRIEEDHAPYIASWLEVLRNDKRAIFHAVADAQRATDYLHSLQPSRMALAL